MAAVLAVGGWTVLQDVHAEVVDIAVGVDPRERIERADDGGDPQEAADHVPLELLEPNAQPVALDGLPDARVLGIEPEVPHLPEADGRIADADESIAEADKIVPVRLEDAEEKAAPLVEDVLAHHVPGA